MAKIMRVYVPNIKEVLKKVTYTPLWYTRDLKKNVEK